MRPGQFVVLPSSHSALCPCPAETAQQLEWRTGRSSWMSPTSTAEGPIGTVLLIRGGKPSLPPGSRWKCADTHFQVLHRCLLSVYYSLSLQQGLPGQLCRIKCKAHTLIALPFCISRAPKNETSHGLPPSFTNLFQHTMLASGGGLISSSTWNTTRWG